LQEQNVILPVKANTQFTHTMCHIEVRTVLYNTFSTVTKQRQKESCSSIFSRRNTSNYTVFRLPELCTKYQWSTEFELMILSPERATASGNEQYRYRLLIHEGLSTTAIQTRPTARLTTAALPRRPASGWRTATAS